MSSLSLRALAVVLAMLLGACSTPKPKTSLPVPGARDTGQGTSNLWSRAGVANQSFGNASASAQTGSSLPAGSAAGAPPMGTSGLSASTGGNTGPVVAPAAKAASHLDPKSGIATQRTIFFDFDDYSIKPEFENLVNEHGQYLLAHPELAVRVEGHADERGSSEYNLALGQKRAVAVSSALKKSGVKAAQIETISFGSEKPVARGRDESAWAQNRRVEIQYPKK